MTHTELIMLKDAWDIVDELETRLEENGLHLDYNTDSLARRIRDWHRDIHRMISDAQGTTGFDGVIEIRE